MGQLQDFVIFFLSIIIESLPFVVAGVVVSVVVALFVSEEIVVKYLPKNRFLSHLYIAFFGIFVPVCQCGNIPVARRLMKKGFSVSQATTFLLAAPLVNPITFWTTWEAFQLNHAVAVIRVVAGLFIAYTVGIYLSFDKHQEHFLTSEFSAECHIHEKTHRSVTEALDIFQSEFILIMKMLCLGALVAALIQTFVPRQTVLMIGQNQYLSIVAMLILGFVISICSTVDAFFALSFINNFTLGSILTFLVFSPLVDIKMLFMMKTSYRVKFIIAISIFIAIVSFLIGLSANYFKL